ncbi:unnamed protein product [Staurois parvus]|uniref:Uncharacterized protein n=1 Tax=Staurois parvus TaxID=386267 RepID=A0ABN9BP57_9NEOB|nr:unnamed protein product [Staurois parvus]
MVRGDHHGDSPLLQNCSGELQTLLFCFFRASSDLIYPEEAVPTLCPAHDSMMGEDLQDIHADEWEGSITVQAPVPHQWLEVDEEGKRLLLKAGI